jgi:hypothetical protein
VFVLASRRTNQSWATVSASTRRVETTGRDLPHAPAQGGAHGRDDSYQKIEWLTDLTHRPAFTKYHKSIKHLGLEAPDHRRLAFGPPALLSSFVARLIDCKVFQLCSSF